MKIVDIFFSMFKRKNKTESQIVKPKKTWEFLKSRYKVEKMLLNSELNLNMGELPAWSYRFVQMIEDDLIALMPNKFDREIFRIFARHHFDIVDLYESDWRGIVKDFCKKSCHFLYWGTVYPAQPTLWGPLPISGQDFFWYLLKLSQDNDADNSVDRIGKILEKINFKKIIEEKKLLGHEISEEDARNLGGRLIVVFMSRECSKESSVLIDILSEIEGGEEFIKKILDEIKIES